MIATKFWNYSMCFMSSYLIAIYIVYQFCSRSCRLIWFLLFYFFLGFTVCFWKCSVVVVVTVIFCIVFFCFFYVLQPIEFYVTTTIKKKSWNLTINERNRNPRKVREKFSRTYAETPITTKPRLKSNENWLESIEATAELSNAIRNTVNSSSCESGNLHWKQQHQNGWSY